MTWRGMYWWCSSVDSGTISYCVLLRNETHLQHISSQWWERFARAVCYCMLCNPCKSGFCVFENLEWFQTSFMIVDFCADVMHLQIEVLDKFHQSQNEKLCELKVEVEVRRDLELQIESARREKEIKAAAAVMNFDITDKWWEFSEPIQLADLSQRALRTVGTVWIVTVLIHLACTRSNALVIRRCMSIQYNNRHGGWWEESWDDKLTNSFWRQSYIVCLLLLLFVATGDYLRHSSHGHLSRLWKSADCNISFLLFCLRAAEKGLLRPSFVNYAWGNLLWANQLNKSDSEWQQLVNTIEQPAS